MSNYYRIHVQYRYAAKSSAYSVLDNDAPLHNLYSDGIFAVLPPQATIVPTGSSLPPTAVEVIVNPDSVTLEKEIPSLR